MITKDLVMERARQYAVAAVVHDERDRALLIAAYLAGMNSILKELHDQAERADKTLPNKEDV